LDGTFLPKRNGQVVLAGEKSEILKEKTKVNMYP
jgi:hypothetical protein